MYVCIYIERERGSWGGCRCSNRAGTSSSRAPRISRSVPLSHIRQSRHIYRTAKVHIRQSRPDIRQLRPNMAHIRQSRPYIRQSRPNMAHTRQSRPDSGIGFQVKVRQTFEGVVPSSRGAGQGQVRLARPASPGPHM